MLAKNLSKRTFSVPVYRNRIGGEWVASKGTSSVDIICPASQQIVGKTPQSTEAEFNAIVADAKNTFDEWKEVSVSNRMRFMLKYQELLKQNQDDISRMITKEHGKSILDANGDVFRGYEVVEHACSFPSLI